MIYILKSVPLAHARRENVFKISTTAIKTTSVSHLICPSFLLT